MDFGRIRSSKYWSVLHRLLYARLVSTNIIITLASAVLPPSNLTNLVLSEAFGISFIRYPAYTVLPTLAAALAVYLLIAFVLFTSEKQIPTEIDTAALDAVPALTEAELEGLPAMRTDEVNLAQHNPYAINDKHGAIIGSFLFIATLIVLVGTSPLNVAVWKITIPPAVVMFLRDVWHDRTNSNSRLVQYPVLDCVQARERVDRTLQEASHECWTMLSAWQGYRKALPTVSTVLSRLPLSCVLFALSMFILVQGITTRGWVDAFAKWWSAWIHVCSKAGTGSAVVGAVGMMLLLSIVLCNVSSSHLVLKKKY